MERFDAVVIGGGMAGLPLALRAARHDHVALIERELLGGTCPNRGCIPTKTMIASANVAHSARNAAAAFGVHTSAPTVDLAAVVDRKNGVVVDSIRRGSYRAVENDTVSSCARGDAHFVGFITPTAIERNWPASPRLDGSPSCSPPPASTRTPPSQHSEISVSPIESPATRSPPSPHSRGSAIHPHRCIDRPTSSSRSPAADPQRGIQQQAWASSPSGHASSKARTSSSQWGTAPTCRLTRRSRPCPPLPTTSTSTKTSNSTTNSSPPSATSATPPSRPHLARGDARSTRRMARRAGRALPPRRTLPTRLSERW